MAQIAQWLATAAMAGMMLPGLATAQTADGSAVKAAADRFAADIMWRPATVIEADFNCTGKVQPAILGMSEKQIAVAIFTQGLNQPPALVRFDVDGRNPQASKIRVDDYSLSAEEIAGVSGATPTGYRPSTTCHGVRLSDDSYEAAHIYWDHDNQRFETWAQ